MEEEIVLEEVVEEVVEQPEELDIEEETPEEDNEFNPDEEGFDEEDYIFEGYDISAFKDRLDLSTDDNIKTITDYLTGLQDKGFTQEQVEFLLEREISDAEQEEEPVKKTKTAAEIKEELRANLTREERRNYKAINSFVTEALAGSELETFKKEIMGNPNLVKLMNVMYVNSLGKTGNINRTVAKKSEKAIGSLVDYDDAVNQIKESLSKRDKEGAKALAQTLSKNVSNKENFVAICKAMGLL